MQQLCIFIALSVTTLSQKEENKNKCNIGNVSFALISTSCCLVLHLTRAQTRIGNARKITYKSTRQNEEKSEESIDYLDYHFGNVVFKGVVAGYPSAKCSSRRMFGLVNSC